MAYWLEQENYIKTADIYHHHIAHWFTGNQGADFIGDMMIKINARPVRKAFAGDTHDFESVEKAFADNLGLFESLADETAKIIQELDSDYKNKYVVIKLEQLLENLQTYVRISWVWYEKAKLYRQKDKLYAFDKDFAGFIDIP